MSKVINGSVRNVNEMARSLEFTTKKKPVAKVGYRKIGGIPVKSDILDTK
jgi:hypothetical protein